MEDIAQASEDVGFDVRVPSYLPAKDLRLDGVHVNSGPPGIANVPSHMKSVAIGLVVEGDSEVPRVRIIIEQYGGPIQHPDGATLVDSGVPGAELYVVSASRSKFGEYEVYTFVNADRGYDVLVGGSEAPWQDKVLKMLRSLVT